ncbi:MAG: FecR domain-containing protein [Candidatus Gracilibacteria bacterium]|nr:FecR domain-containing protein [Candidatus Gracilibacteria bacterium]
MQNSSEVPKRFFQKHAITLTMFGLLAIIGLLLFSDFSKSPTIISEKIDPYVLSTKGKTLIFREKQSISVEENDQAPIFTGDKIRTLDSTATIFWPDGSITRLGEKSSIKIREMRAKTANENIQVDFSLEQGKSWSNVMKYMFGDSYFHERFNNDTALAAVRGTVFEVNLDRRYIHTIDHAVSIEDIGSHTGSTFVVAGGVFDTDTRKALVRSTIDEAWAKANSSADAIYLNERMESLKKQILGYAGQTNYMDIFLQKAGLKKTDSSLNSLLTGDATAWSQFENEMKQGKDSTKLMDIYQEFYGLGNTEKLIDTKMKLRDLIMETAPKDKKQMLLDDFTRSTLYDSWNALQTGTGNIEGLQKKLKDYIKQGADRKMIDTLQNAAQQEGIRGLDTILENTKQTIIQTLGEKNLLDEAGKGVNAATLEQINNTATEVRNSITDGLKKLTQ